MPKTLSKNTSDLIQQANYAYHAGNYKKALSYFHKAAAANPKSIEALYKIGVISFRLGMIQEAASSLKKCVSLDRKNINALIMHGRLLREIGDLEGSLRSYRLALKANPGNLDAIAGIAAYHEYYKNYNKALETIEPYCTPATINPQIAILFSRICNKTDSCEKAVRYLNDCLTSGLIRDDDTQSFLYYSLGDIHDGIEQYELAFNAYRSANECRKLQYDEFKHANQIKMVQETFNYTFLQTRQVSGLESERPIFIVGMPRSGTSLIEQILSSHPDVHGAGELTTINRIAAKITEQVRTASEYSQAYRKLGSNALRQFAQEYLDTLKTFDKKKRFVTDKMPHNYLQLGLISMLFPNCRIIHCRRDPIDTCLSIYFRTFNDSHDYATDLNALAHHYSSYDDLMRHWRGVLPLKLYEIRYEDLVQNFRIEAEKLLAFCNLEWHDDCLEFFKTKRHVATASENQVNQPLYTSSIGRWRHYAPFIQPLVEKLDRLK